MNTYKYTSVNPCHFILNGNQYSLHQDELYELPDSKQVTKLVALGLLQKKEVTELPEKQKQLSKNQNKNNSNG
jgi:hypothetical protein